MSTIDQALKSSFPPIANDATRLLILGSLPGEISLLREQYYANPRNQFWRLIEAVAGSRFPDSYVERLELLRELGIGLWDTVKSARRKGSLDTAIRNHEPNALDELVARLPSLEAIAFNGGKSSKTGRAQLGLSLKPTLLDLPSSSPALTIPFERKLSAWLQLRPYIISPPTAAH